jgi:hypothetical protein
MGRTLSSFVAVFCLLVLLVSSAACLVVPQIALTLTQHTHLSSADHACCPQHSSSSEHTSTTCCTVHHQPVSGASGIEIEQPAAVTNAQPVPFEIAATTHPPTGRKTIQPQKPPTVPLRI